MSRCVEVQSNGEKSVICVDAPSRSVFDLNINNKNDSVEYSSSHQTRSSQQENFSTNSSSYSPAISQVSSSRIQASKGLGYTSLTLGIASTASFIVGGAFYASSTVSSLLILPLLFKETREGIVQQVRTGEQLMIVGGALGGTALSLMIPALVLRFGK